MMIILFRHGIAESRDGEKPDHERRLTKEGKREMKRTARALAGILPDAGAIYSSPLVRAYETAERLARAYEERLSIETTAALEPGSDVEDFRALLRQTGASSAYYVGHEPNLTELMLALTHMHAGETLSLKKGGCYGIELKEIDEPARLRWMLAPDVLIRE